MTWRRILCKPLPCGIAVVTGAAAYLAGPARDNMDAVTAAAVLIHISVGCLLIAPVAWAMLRVAQRRNGGFDRLLLSCVSLFAGLCAFTGIYETVRAAGGHSTTGDTASMTAHILGGVFAIALAAICIRRYSNRSEPSDERLKSRMTEHDVRRRAQNPPFAEDITSSPESLANPVTPSPKPPRMRPPELGGRGANQGLRDSPAIPGSSDAGGANPELGSAYPLADGARPDLGKRAAASRLRAVARPLLAAIIPLTLTQGALFGAAALLPAYNAQDYYRDLTATNAEQAQNPLFPAGLRLKTGLGDLDVNSLRGPLPTSASCGVSGCHPVAFQQWSASAHRFAGSDPLYAASLKESIKTSGPGIRTWCQSCHAPSEVVQQALQSGGASFKSRESEGVGCYACHGTVGTPTRTGDGRFVLAEPMDYPFAGDTGWRGKLHDFLIRVRPGPHQRAFLKPDLHRSSEFCSSCHRQSLTLAQNHYRFVRGPDEYGEWARGPASARSARTADSRPARTCQECHFRAQAGGRISVSHTSLGGISGLGGTMGHASNLEANGAQLRKAISLDIIAIRRIRPDGLPGETIAPLNSPHGPYELAAGTACLLDIVVRNQGVGHSFPAGYTDLTEAWLEVTIPDANGKPLLSNGTLSSGQSIIPPDAHSYGSLGLDKKGNPVLKHNLPMQVTEAYHRTIPAGGADVARYRFVVPRLLTRSGSKHESIRLSARLRYRSVRPDFLRWARGQTSRPGNARDISSTPAILTLAETEIALPLEGSEPASHAASSEDEATLADRFVRYGYGLLAPVEKPDIRGAKYAFDRAKEISPTSPDSWIGSGRAFLAEREFILAARNFEGAMALSPGNGAASAELSVIYRKQGQFDRAIGVLTPLVDRYPNDAALRYEQGLALFGAGRYRDAAESFRASLAIDPDQSEVHSHLKLCYDVLRRAPEGRLEDSITRYLGEDLLAAQLVPAYLKKHPEVAQRAAPFPIHELR